jgi:nitroreductase
VSEILKLPKYVKAIGIITLGYPRETEFVERFERIPMEDLIHY